MGRNKNHTDEIKPRNRGDTTTNILNNNFLKNIRNITHNDDSQQNSLKQLFTKVSEFFFYLYVAKIAEVHYFLKSLKNSAHCSLY